MRIRFGVLMCGICGIYGTDDLTLVKKMNKTLTHRGPDDEGFYSDRKVTLGHRRLSIIDLESGHQPIHNENESIWVILNGEIYNFKELRKELEKKGHKFYTHSDTEVIVHLYEDYGYSMLKKLDGMFSLALWDATKERLLLARDPLGKKPLYYYIEKSGNLLFASEIKAILGAGVRKKINTESLNAYLSYQYIPGVNTLFQGIKKLLSGHFLIIEKNECYIQKYWDIAEKMKKYDDKTAIKYLRFLLEKSIKKRMIADVPIGAFVSGGIDSSTVTALAKPHVEYDFHTFSIGFESFSELEFAKIVSDHLGTIHHEIIVTEEMVENSFNKVTWHYDEPIGDAAILNNYFLSEKANKYVKVVLAGEAGDELFAGYNEYQMHLKLFKLMKNPFLRFSLKIMNLFKNGDLYQNRLLRKSNYLDYFLIEDLQKAHQNAGRMLSEKEMQWLVNLKDFEDSAVYPTNINYALNKIQATDCKNLLPERYLLKADKATMANAIEQRLPLMDKQIIDFAFSLDQNLKIRGNEEKYILRMAVKDLLPPEILKRKKQGFGTPIAQWVNNGLRDDILSSLEENELIKFYFKDESVKKIADRLNNRQNGYESITWTIFALSRWYDVWFTSS